MTNSAPPSHLVAGFHSRGSLPHLKREGATYFVTFRLAGTLPHTLIESSKHEREAILRHALAAKRPLTWHEQKELFRWYSERVDRHLDCGLGVCHLRSPACANIVAEALGHFAGERYELHAWVVMPNHAHAVVWPRPPHTLSEILHTWKSFSAHEINKVLPKKVQHLWQRESYDHLIEDDDDLHHCARYTVMNPVSAKLCAEAHQWPWSSAHVAQPSPVASRSTVPVRLPKALPRNAAVTRSLAGCATSRRHFGQRLLRVLPVRPPFPASSHHYFVRIVWGVWGVLDTSAYSCDPPLVGPTWAWRASNPAKR